MQGTIYRRGCMQVQPGRRCKGLERRCWHLGRRCNGLERGCSIARKKMQKRDQEEDAGSYEMMQGTIESGCRKPGRRCKGLERGCWHGIDARDYRIRMQGTSMGMQEARKKMQGIRNQKPECQIIPLNSYLTCKRILSDIINPFLYRTNAAGGPVVANFATGIPAPRYNLRKGF